MDAWGWEHLGPWLTQRLGMRVGPLFCIIDGPTRERPCSGLPRSVASSAGTPPRQA